MKALLSFTVTIGALLLPSFAQETVDLGKGRPGDILHVHFPPDPVNVRNGNFYLPVQDYYLPCFSFPLEIYRSYNSVSTRNGPFGKGWTFNYDIQIVVGDQLGMRVIEADGFLNEYLPVEAEEKNHVSDITKIVEAKKKEDVKYTGNPKGKGDAAYVDYKKKLESDRTFYERQRDRYLPVEAKISESGKYVSRKRGTTYLEKTKNGFIRTTETGRKEEYDVKGLLTRISDRNENELTMKYNAESRLVRVQDACGQSVQLSYDPHGKINLVSDSLQRKLTYTYDDQDHLIGSVALDGEKTAFTYDKKDRMTAISFGDGTKTEMTYDSKTSYVTKQVGPGTKVTTYKYGRDGPRVWADVEDNEGGKSRYEYIDADNKIIFTDKQGAKTITIVSPCCGKPLSIKNEKGVGEEFRYDAKDNLVEKIDATKKPTTFAYEPRFNLLSEIKSGDGITSRYLYDKKGNLSFATSSDGKHVKLIYESHGKIEQMTDHKDNVILFKYNSFGKPTSIEKKAKANRVGLIKVTYDPSGEINNVAYEPANPEIVQNIKDTLASFLRLLKPSGIDFEI